MAASRPTIPLSVPAALAGSQAGGTSDVSVQAVTDPTALDTKPDARQNQPAAGATPGAAAGAPAAATPATGTENGSGDRSSTTDVTAKPADATAAAANQAPPTNHQQVPKKKKKEKKKADTTQTQ